MMDMNHRHKTCEFVIRCNIPQGRIIGVGHPNKGQEVAVLPILQHIFIAGLQPAAAVFIGPFRRQANKQPVQCRGTDRKDYARRSA